MAKLIFDNPKNTDLVYFRTLFFYTQQPLTIFNLKWVKYWTRTWYIKGLISLHVGTPLNHNGACIMSKQGLISAQYQLWWIEGPEARGYTRAEKWHMFWSWPSKQAACQMANFTAKTLLIISFSYARLELRELAKHEKQNVDWKLWMTDHHEVCRIIIWATRTNSLLIYCDDMNFHPSLGTNRYRGSCLDLDEKIGI